MEWVGSGGGVVGVGRVLEGGGVEGLGLRVGGSGG